MQIVYKELHGSMPTSILSEPIDFASANQDLI
jgi:hypothetical protein